MPQSGIDPVANPPIHLFPLSKVVRSQKFKHFNLIWILFFKVYSKFSAILSKLKSNFSTKCIHVQNVLSRPKLSRLGVNLTFEMPPHAHASCLMPHASCLMRCLMPHAHKVTWRPPSLWFWPNFEFTKFRKLTGFFCWKWCISMKIVYIIHSKMPQAACLPSSGEKCFVGGWLWIEGDQWQLGICWEQYSCVHQVLCWLLFIAKNSNC